MKNRELFRVIQEVRWISTPMRIRFLKWGDEIGKNTVIRAQCYFNGRHIKIGEDCFVNYFCKFYSHQDDTSCIELEDNVVVAMNVIFCTHTHDILGENRRASKYTITKPIKVCKGTWIGANAIVLPGVRIGEGCVIAAGSVVANDCEDNSLYAGVPARLIRKL